MMSLFIRMHTYVRYLRFDFIKFLEYLHTYYVELLQCQ
jgi:hypothetical protein